MRALASFLFILVCGVASHAQQWNNLGPVQPPEGSATNGQINCVAFNPLNPLRMYAGAPAGGLWVSVDGGASWLPGATDTLGVHGISDIWVNPNDSNSIVIAMGDRDENSSFVTQGGALYQTTDGGVSWTRSGELDTNGSIVPIPNYTSSRVVRNTTTGAFVLGTSAGVFLSTNYGLNWNNRILREKTWDLKQRPNDPNTLYAVSGGRIFRSVNGGTSFSVLTTGFPNQVAVRIQLAVAPSNANVVYAMYVQTNGSFGGLYKSSDAGNTWSMRSSVPNILAANLDGSGSKGVNNLALAVSPVNENIVFAGGVNIWRSVDGGQTWQQTSHYRGVSLPYVAADIHDLRFAPAPRANFLYAATGNGIFMTSDTGRTWVNASQGLQVHQGLSTSQHPLRDSVFLTAGPTGVYRYDHAAWKKLSDSSALQVWYHPRDARVAYMATASGRLLKSVDSAQTFAADISPASSQAGVATSPYIPNPKNPATMYALLKDIHKTSNGGVSWSRTSNPFGSPLLSLDVSPADTQMVYIITADTNIYQSTNGGKDWVRKSKVQLQFPMTPRAVYCHPRDAQRVCVIGGRSISMSTDGGVTWNKYVLNGNLAIQSFVWKLDNCGEALYCGTTNGVWKLSAQYSFGVPEQVGSGMPNSPVSDLDLTGRFLRATTIGRGVYSTFIDDAGVVPSFTQDKDSVCPGEAVQFNDVSMNGGISSIWRFEGGVPPTSTESAPMVRFDTPGFHKITLVAANGCGKDSVTLPSVFVIPRLKAAVQTARNSVCKGDTLIVRDATIGVGGTRTWSADGAFILSTSSTGVTAICTTTGTCTFNLTVTNECGTTSASKTIDVYDIPDPVRIVITKDTMSVPAVNGLLYQWFANGSQLSAATGSTWIGRYNGQYFVRVSNAGGCKVYSDTVAFVVPKDTSGGTSVIETADGFSLTPQPVVDLLRIRVRDAWQGEYGIRIVDLLGRTVMTVEGNAGSGTGEVSVPVEGLAAGSYQCILHCDGRTASGRFVKAP